MMKDCDVIECDVGQIIDVSSQKRARQPIPISQDISQNSTGKS